MGVPVYEFEVDQSGDVIVLARLKKKDSSHNMVALQPADVASVTRTVTSLRDGSAVAGPTPLTVNAVVLGGLSTGSVWTRDAEGFNFIDVVPAAELPGTEGYRVRYTFTLAAGQTFYLKLNAHVRPNA